MTDASDLGILASDVVIVVDLEDVDSFDGVADGPAAEKVLYCVDLRPTTCGITWGRARDGLVSSQALSSRCRPHCPDGFYVVVIGGVPIRGSDGFDLRVHPGSTLSVEFVRLPGPIALAALPPEDPHGPDSDSSSSDTDSS